MHPSNPVYASPQIHSHSYPEPHPPSIHYGNPAYIQTNGDWHVPQSSPRCPPHDHQEVAILNHAYDKVHIVDSKRGPSQIADRFLNHVGPQPSLIPSLSFPVQSSSMHRISRLPTIPSRTPFLHSSRLFSAPHLNNHSSRPMPSKFSLSPGSPSGFKSLQNSSQKSNSNNFNNPLRPVQNSVPLNGGVGKIDLGLDRMLALMSILPPIRTPAIHLAGTNGKGSVSAILESCLRASGLSVARYNSPHLLEPRDAIRINGSPPSREVYASALGRVQLISATTGLEATTFEIATAAAYLLISETTPPIDVMIIECGMGGKNDATNVIPPQLILGSGLTSVGLDHTDFLGSTYTEIATQKASIAVSGGYLFVAPKQHPDVLAVVTQLSAIRGFRSVEALPSEAISEASESNKLSFQPFKIPSPTLVRTPVPLVFDSPSRVTGVQPFIDTALSLEGAHQLDNLSLAITMLHVLRLDARALKIQPKLEGITDSRIERGVAAAKWEGRCSWLLWQNEIQGREYPVLVDGAHNADSAVLLRRYIDNLGLSPDIPITFIVSMSHSPSKPVNSVLSPLVRKNDRVIAVNFTTPVEGMPWIRPAPKESVRLAAQTLVGHDGQAWAADYKDKARDELVAALQWAFRGWESKPGLVVICGSLYLVADMYRLLRGD